MVDSYTYSKKKKGKKRIKSLLVWKKGGSQEDEPLGITVRLTSFVTRYQFTLQWSLFLTAPLSSSHTPRSTAPFNKENPGDEEGFPVHFDDH